MEFDQKRSYKIWFRFFKRKKVNPLVITTSYQEKNYDYLVQKDQKDEINDFLKDKDVNVIILEVIFLNSFGY